MGQHLSCLPGKTERTLVVRERRFFVCLSLNCLIQPVETSPKLWTLRLAAIRELSHACTQEARQTVCSLSLSLSCLAPPILRCGAGDPQREASSALGIIPVRKLRYGSRICTGLHDGRASLGLKGDNTHTHAQSIILVGCAAPHLITT